MRAVVIGAIVAALALAGCGGGDDPAPPATAAPAPEATPEPAREIVYLYRVQGDDPLPDSVSVRADGSAAIRRGGGRGGFRAIDAQLSDSEIARARRLTRRAPWAALDGSTVEPGGFGGSDNDMRYMLRRGERSITVTAERMPRRLRPLVRELDAIIAGERGRAGDPRVHSGVS
jgi:hypothetical protein